MSTRWSWALCLLSIGCGGELGESAPATVGSAPIERPPIVADADVDESTVRVHFTSTASPYIVDAAACSLQLRVDDTHVFDVRTGDRRCATTPMLDDAIPVVVRIEKRNVVLEATTAAEVTPAWLRLVLPQIANALEAKVVAAHVSLREARSTANDPNHGVKSGGIGAWCVFTAFLGGVGLVLGVVAALASPSGRGFSF